MTGFSRGVTDIRYAVRTLARHPAFTGAVVTTLAVAIGANVALFAIVNALVFRPLPFPGQDRLVILSSAAKSSGRRLGVSYADYADWLARARSFEAIGIAGGRNYVMSGMGQAELVDGARSTAGLFRVIGLPPLLGRVFTEREDRPGGDAVVVLGQSLWERRFDADPSILGRVLRLDGRDCMVIGVMPRDFAYPDHAELWVPMASDPLREDRASRAYGVIARLGGGVTLDLARSEMRRIVSDLAREHPVTNGEVDVVAASLAGVRGPRGVVFALLVALGAGGLVLLTACANVANLLLARMTSRTRELAIRAALGASRFQIARLLALEALVLTLPASALGLLIGQTGRDLIVATVPSGIPVWMRFDTDWRVLGFTITLSLLTAVATGVSPGLHGARRPPLDALKESGGSTGAATLRLRSVLVVSEVAVTLVLLVGAGLMVRTFFNATRIDPGFRPAGLLTLRVPLPAAGYAPDRRAAFYDSLAARLGALPGVSAVGLTSALPIAAEGRGIEYEVEEATAPGRPKALAARSAVSEAFFRTAGLPIVAGRAFDSRDGSGGVKVAIVSRALAERQWPLADPLGKRLRFPGGATESSWLTVVGVAGEVRSWRLEDNSLPRVYVPFAQAPTSSMTLVVRSSGDPSVLAEAVRAEVRRADPDVAVVDLLPFDAVIRRSLWAERLFTRIFEAFGLVALGLALLGIYGVISYSVAQRTREIGIRAALGADRRSLGWLVLRDGARLALVGVAIGLMGSWAATRAMTRLLYGVSPHDALTFGAVSLLLLAVSGVAAYLPARRAARMDPLRALQEG